MLDTLQSPDKPTFAQISGHCANPNGSRHNFTESFLEKMVIDISPAYPSTTQYNTQYFICRIVHGVLGWLL